MDKEMKDMETTETTEPVEETETEEVQEEQEEGIDLLELLETDENVKKQFQSEVDRMITRAIQTRDKKHQQEIEEQERRAKMTAEEIQAEKERELQEREEQLLQYEMKLKKVEYFKENNIPLDLIDFISVQSEEEIEEKSQVLMDVINAQVEQQIKSELKKNGIDMGVKEEEPFTLDDLEGMSPEEINKYWNNLV